MYDERRNGFLQHGSPLDNPRLISLDGLTRFAI
jgi:hypothetical protein